jgi:zinc protease
VKDFYRRWYVANNVSLVIAGDFDPAKARQWVTKYFGEFERARRFRDRLRARQSGGDQAAVPRGQFRTAAATYFELADRPLFHPDQAPLEILFALLTKARKRRFMRARRREEADQWGRDLRQQRATCRRNLPPGPRLSGYRP